MKALITLCLVLLTSSYSISSTQDNFVKVSSAYSVKSNALELNPKYIPPIRSQDSLGICFGMCGAAVANYYICKTEDRNCAALGDQGISPLGATAFSRTDFEDQRPGDSSNHNTIRFGGSCVSVLENMSKTEVMNKDSCYPFDDFANKYGNDQKTVDAVLKKIEDMYNRRTEADFCADCLKNEVNNLLLSNMNDRDLKSALSRKNFGLFLYTATVSRRTCKDEDFYSFPRNARPQFGKLQQIGMASDGQYELKPIKVSTIIDQIKTVLAKDYPVSLGNICPQSKGNECPETHAVMVTGYRKQCKPNGKECREVIRIHNSWGRAWQDQFDGGWVDVKSLFEGKDSYPAELGWWLPPGSK